jgi:hypothetical protein
MAMHRRQTANAAFGYGRIKGIESCMSNRTANILAIAAFFWPYALLFSAWVLAIISDRNPWMIGASGTLGIVGAWRIAFRELWYMT